MMNDEILNDTFLYMRQRFNKNLYANRKNDYDVYLNKLKQLNSKSNGKKNNH